MRHTCSSFAALCGALELFAREDAGASGCNALQDLLHEWEQTGPAGHEKPSYVFPSGRAGLPCILPCQRNDFCCGCVVCAVCEQRSPLLSHRATPHCLQPPQLQHGASSSCNTCVNSGSSTTWRGRSAVWREMQQQQVVATVAAGPRALRHRMHSSRPG